MGAETPEPWARTPAENTGESAWKVRFGGQSTTGQAKAISDFTDLMGVSTSTGQPGQAQAPGAPLTAPGEANDPLGSIVREHLDRAASAGNHPIPVPTPPPVAEVTPEETPVEKPAEAPAESLRDAVDAAVLGQEATGATQEVQAVQREFAKLFEEDPQAHAAAPKEPGFVDPHVGERKPPPGITSAVDVDDAALSQAEFEALLNAGPEAEKAPPTPAPETEPEADAESAIKTAEGVLEAELLQLMGSTLEEKTAETITAPAPSAPAVAEMEKVAPNATDTTPPVDVLTAAPLPSPAELPPITAQAVAAPEPPAEAVIAAPAPAEAPPPAPATAPAAATAIAATAAPLPAAPAGMTAPPPVIIEPPDIEPDEELEPRGSLWKDITLMVGQLIDLPFAWISEYDKHLIGLAAFLLLAGGAVLWVLSWMLPVWLAK